MKKILSLLLCVVFVLSLAACGGNNNATSTTGKKATAIEITEEKIEVLVDETVKLNAKVTPADGTVKWSSSDNEIATVNANGIVSGIASGSAVITCASEDGSVKDTVDVKVVAFGSIKCPIDAQREDGYIEIYEDTDAHAILIPVDAKPMADNSSIINFVTNKYENGVIVMDSNNYGAVFQAEDIPAGDYLFLIFCSYKYKQTLPADILVTEGYDKYFSADELSALYNKIKDNKVWFEKITIKANETFEKKYTAYHPKYENQ